MKIVGENMSYEGLLALLEPATGTKCLQSGECCYSQEVHGVPGYEEGVKPAFRVCIHLVPAERDENRRWHRARCLLHDTPSFPDECRSFNFPGPNHQCALGQEIWKKRGVRNFEKELLD